MCLFFSWNIELLLNHLSFIDRPLKSDHDYGYQKSSVKQGELNPVWNEDFQFNIPTLDNMVLTLQCYDSDIGSRDDKCGKCKIKLEHEGITRSPKRIEKTIDRNLLRANGKIVVEISYHD